MKKLLFLLLSTYLFGDTITYYKKGFAKQIILENVEYINVENIRKTKYLKFKNLKKKNFYVKCEKIISWIDENGNKKEFDCDKLKKIDIIKDIKRESGFGITFNNDGLVGEILFDGESPYSTPTIYFINDKIKYKIETGISYSGFQEANIFSIGFGYLKNKKNSENYNRYSGFRVNGVFLIPSDFKANLYKFAPIAGSEYKFNKNFTIGGEIRMNFLYSTIIPDFDLTFRYLSSHLFFRFYNY